MAHSDPIADYLTRLRNAIQAKHKKVEIPASNLKKDMTRILAENKLITLFDVVESSNKQGVIRIALRYYHGSNVIKGTRRVSTPGRRVYRAVDNLPRVNNGLGLAIVSTPKGLMTDRQARKENVGGEVLCLIW
ncbi:MAG: 30S ribosomal protein S8 [Bacteroidota bacterium]|nr:30S ribosomal protein S8 [Bacteroidota bacterium]